MRIVGEEIAPRFFAGPLDCPPIPCPAICVEADQLQEQILLFLKNIYLERPEVDRLLTIVEEERTEERTKERQAGGGIKQAVEKLSKVVS